MYIYLCGSVHVLLCMLHMCVYIHMVVYMCLWEFMYIHTHCVCIYVARLEGDYPDLFSSCGWVANEYFF